MLKRDKHHKKLNNKGMTLVEVIITITILVTVSGLILSAFISSMRASAKARDLHRATTVAQNLMEGIKLKSAEDLAYQFNYPILKNGDDTDASNFSVYLPSMLQFSADKSVGELYPTTDGAGNPIFAKVSAITLAEYKEIQNPALPTYDLEKVKSAASAYTANVKGRNYDFLTDTVGTYVYYIRNLRNDGNYYNAKITLDASTYRTGGASSLEVNSDQLISVPTIDSSIDAVEVMGESFDEAAVAELGIKYPGETINKANLKRTIILTVDSNLMPTGNYRTKVTATYEYKFQMASGSDSDTIELKTSVPFNNEGNEDTKSLRNVYLYYYPLYKEVANKDTIIVNNSDNIDFDLYIIKQELSTVPQSSLQSREQDYRVEVNVNETTNSVDGNSHVSLITNLNESLYSVYLSGSTALEVPGQATFKRNGIGVASPETTYRLTDLRNKQASDRMYNVTIEIFSSEKAENLSSFEAQGIDTWFKEDNRLITISSSISQ